LYLGELGRRAAGTPVPILGVDVARALLRDLAREARGMIELRRVYAEARSQASICGVSDHAVLDDLARRLMTGELQARTVALRPPEAPAGAEVSAPRPPLPAPAPAAETTWFEIQVLFTDTAAAVSSLRLKIKPPSGDAAEHTTNADGIIRIEGIKERGDCVVSSDVKGVKRAEALTVAAAPSSPAPPPAEKKGKPPAYKLVVANPYKVKTGDTLDKLAKRVGMTAKELAGFNWGTEVAREINQHLRWDVGCTKKSSDGKSFVFDDTDEPGLIVLPEPLKLTAPTGGRVVVGVAKVAASRPWIFSL
jgi:LysM repeat protein